MELGRVKGDDIEKVWDDFGDLIPSVFKDVVSEYDMFIIGRLWDIFYGSNSHGPFGLAFVSKGNRVGSFHVCLKPRAWKSMWKVGSNLVNQIGRASGVDYLLVQSPKGHKVEKFIKKVGFEKCGEIPVDDGDTVSDHNLYKFHVRSV